MVLLNKITLENFMEQNVLYSKLVRGKLPFKVEVHSLEEGKKLQVYLYRDHDRIEEFLDTGNKKGALTEQSTTVQANTGVLRLTINDEKFMINSAGNATINIKEINFNNKKINLVDFPHGKVAILIDINFEDVVDHVKFKKEIKDYFTEA